MNTECETSCVMVTTPHKYTNVSHCVPRSDVVLCGIVKHITVLNSAQITTTHVTAVGVSVVLTIRRIGGRAGCLVVGEQTEPFLALVPLCIGTPPVEAVWASMLPWLLFGFPWLLCVVPWMMWLPVLCETGNNNDWGVNPCDGGGGCCCWGILGYALDCALTLSCTA